MLAATSRAWITMTIRHAALDTLLPGNKPSTEIMSLAGLEFATHTSKIRAHV